MNKKIRILVNAIPLMNIRTGIGRYLECLYTELEKSYADRLDIWYFDGSSIRPQIPKGPVNLGRWSRITDLFWKIPAYPAFVFRLAYHYKRELIFKKLSRHFDIYHEAGFFPFCVASGVKTVFTIHDLSLARYPEYHPIERVLYYRFFMEQRCKQADHFLSVSKFTRLEMEKVLKICPSDVSITHLSHDHQFFYPKPSSEVKKFLSSNCLPEKYFLFVGSGDPRKNLDIIPAAMQIAGSKEQLIVAGWSGWGKKVNWPNVLFLGYLDDDELACLYSGALALIFPSSYEGFGLPLLEAMACGCPVVTTKEASLPEVAKDAAIYMDGPQNIDSLSKIITAFAQKSDIRKNFSRKGFERINAFSWQRTAEITFQAFERVLNR